MSTYFWHDDEGWWCTSGVNSPMGPFPTYEECAAFYRTGALALPKRQLTGTVHQFKPRKARAA